MKPIHPKRTILAAVALSVSLAGCATTGQMQEPDLYSMLYDGESGAAHGTASPVSTPEEAYRHGEAAARAGDYDRALFEYIRGLQMEDEPAAEPLYRIGSIHDQRNNHELAEMAYRRALEVDPSHPEAGTSLGIMELQRRRYSEAEAQLRAVTDEGNANWRTYNALGVLADLQGNADEAVRHYTRALRKDPDNATVLNNLGYSRYLSGDWRGARDALRRALRSDPNYEMAWRNLGLVHVREQAYDDALEAFGRSGTDAEAYNDIGYVAMLEGRYADAKFFFEKAMQRSPTFYLTASENVRQAERQIRRNSASRQAY